MGKHYSYLILFILISSCTIPRHTFENKQSASIDFRKGKWLLYNIIAPYSIKEKLTKIAINDFEKLAKNRFAYSNDIKISIPIHVDKEIVKSDLNNIRAATNFDYFIVLKSNKKKEEIASLDITNHKYQTDKSNIGFLEFDVYDLNSGVLIYSQKITGRIDIDKSNSNDVNFATSSNQLILSCYKKLMRKIKRDSYYDK